MSGISTHVLDTSAGKPAAGVAVTLERWEAGAWVLLASAETDAEGRVKPLLPGDDVRSGKHRLTFETEEYFRVAGQDTLYPEVVVVFAVAGDAADYHVPLLVSPFGFTTYRGT